MTVKIDINKYTGNSPLISKMLHMADQGKLGEAENNNGMLDTEKEADRFLKLAEKNKDLLAKHGYKVEGSGGIFTITKTNSNYDAKNYNSVLTYDLKHDYIEENANALDLTAKTVFNNNNNIDVIVQNNETGETYGKSDNKGQVNSLTLAILNVLTLGEINRRFDAINKLSNLLGKTE